MLFPILFTYFANIIFKVFMKDKKISVENDKLLKIVLFGGPVQHKR